MRRLPTLVAAAAAALVAATAALATPPSSGSGTIVPLTDATTGFKQAGGNTFITQHETGMLTGTLSGTYVLDRTIVVHSNGDTAIHAEATCACTIDGRTGVLTDRVNGNGKAGEAITANLVITSASGGLEGLHGDADVTAPPSGPITYTLQYHFDP